MKSLREAGKRLLAKQRRLAAEREALDVRLNAILDQIIAQAGSENICIGCDVDLLSPCAGGARNGACGNCIAGPPL